MTVELVRFERAHLSEFVPQGMQRSESEFADDAGFGEAWTAVAGGRVIGCGGLMEQWEGRAYAWALLAGDAGPHMVGLSRAIRFRLDHATFARIEMVVDASFAAGSRWAELLGFERETPTPLRHYLPGGRAAWLYARFKDGGSTGGRGGGQGGAGL